MENTQSIKSLAALLISLQSQATPMFVSLCSRCGNENFFMDQAIANIQEQYGKQLGYKKISSEASILIKQELKISQNPVLLLINQGEIKAVFGGIIAQHRLEKTLRKLDLIA